jgi:hypothetical protein
LVDVGTIDTSNTKQILFDEDGLAHVALASDIGGSAGVIYLAVDKQWRVLDQRAFSASVFQGIGIDNSGNIHVAMR